MIAVVQRVKNAEIHADGEKTGGIDKGLLVYLGVMEEDGEKEAEYLARKIEKLRIFQDENDKMNLSVKEYGGDILVVSQFTLCADLKKGNRPSFNPAAKPEKAEILYEYFMKLLREMNIIVEHGRFGAHMDVAYHNDGPVTIIYNSSEMMKQRR